MKNFRSICFIYRKSDAYRICYIKEFLKVIGLTYYTHLYDPDKPDAFLENLESSRFDICVAVNVDMQGLYGDRFVSMENPLVLNMEFPHSDRESEDLRAILLEIEKKLLNGCDTHLLFDLYDLYVDNRMTVLLYEYTFTIIKTDKDKSQEFYESIYEKYEKVLSRLDQMPVSYGDPDTGNGHTEFIEYYLFAKYHCRKNMNVLHEARSMIEAYDIIQYLKEVDQIYRYDPEFSKVEFLKAKITETNLMYRTSSRTFYDRCIRKCPVETGKSFHYYALGKWLENHGRPYEAGRAYLSSYRKAPDYIKPAFKLGVDYERKRQQGIAKEYYSYITGIWLGDGDYKQIPLSELEYVYKANQLLNQLTDGGTPDHTEQSEDLFFFVNHMSGTQESFLNKLYGSMEEFMPAISELIRMRLNVTNK